ncbi:MAG: hypothetical protein JW816_01910 [Candidatus Buchananbacteria bacterium]|nr:hypothetical protein [Candidatus Buchananbacteria bacterium]
MTEEKLIKKIKSLKNVKPRSEWQTLNRDFLLSQINQTAEEKSFGWQDYVVAFGSLFRQRLLEPAVVMLLVLGFSVGSSLVVNASFYSLPGDGLYPVKLALESVQIAVSSGDERKVELKIEFAKKRINEFDQIASRSDDQTQEKNDKLAAVVQELQRNVASVQNHINNIDKDGNQSDHDRTLRIAITISNETKQLAQSLDQKAKTISETDPEIKQIVDQAVESVQAVTVSADKLVEEEKQSAIATSTDQIIDQDNQPGEVLGESKDLTEQSSQAEVESADNSQSESTATNIEN